MSNKITTTNKLEDAVDLGTWVGRKQAFSLIAGRCSAADAECLRQMRGKKAYRALGLNWDTFCHERLGISRSSADLIVRQLDEFGPAFFTLAQVMQITAQEYRRLGVAARGNVLLHAGEEILIEAENGPRLLAAIEELRHNARVEPLDVAAEFAPGLPEPAGTRTDAEHRLALAEEHMHAIIAELWQLWKTQPGVGERIRVHSLVGSGAHEFELMRLGMRF